MQIELSQRFGVKRWPLLRTMPVPAWLEHGLLYTAVFPTKSPFKPGLSRTLSSLPELTATFNQQYNHLSIMGLKREDPICASRARINFTRLPSRPPYKLNFLPIIGPPRAPAKSFFDSQFMTEHGTSTLSTEPALFILPLTKHSLSFAASIRDNFFSQLLDNRRAFLANGLVLFPTNYTVICNERATHCAGDYWVLALQLYLTALSTSTEQLPN